MIVKMCKLAVIFGLTAILGAGLSSCQKQKTEEAIVKQVTTFKTVREDVSKTVLFTGSIEAEDYADIYPRGPGKVAKKALKEGDAVKKNQAIMYTERDEVGFTFKPAPIMSPMNGFIGRILVDVGATVSPAIPVATVVKMDKMRVKLDVPERYLPVMATGLAVGLSTPTLPDDVFKGEIISVSQTVDLKTRTVRVEIVIPNEEHKLKHGMFAKLYMPVETHKEALAVPYSSIMWEGDKQSVYAVEGPKVVKKAVTVGIKNDHKVEIIEGLDEGSEVVTEGLWDLKDGDSVTVR